MPAAQLPSAWFKKTCGTTCVGTSASCAPSALSRVNLAEMLIAAAPSRIELPLIPAAAPGFQNRTDASLQGALVAANPRENAHVPISLMPNAWARARLGTKHIVATTARYRVRRCRCISILRCNRTRQVTRCLVPALWISDDERGEAADRLRGTRSSNGGKA